MNSCDLTIIVVNYNTQHLLDRMFACIDAAGAGLNIQIVLIDNASRDDSVSFVRSRYPQVELICSLTNVGFGRGNNLALPRIQGEFVLLLNTDAFVEPKTLRLTIDRMRSEPDIGVLGVKLTDEDGSLQPSCRFFPTPWNMFLKRTGLQRVFTSTPLVDDPLWDPARQRDCDWVPGCYILTRRDVIARIGLFDPRFFLYCEEVDLCKRVKEGGWRVVYCPDTAVIHLGGESAKSDGALSDDGRQLSPLLLESELLYMRKHFGRIGVIKHMVLSGACNLIRLLRVVTARNAPRSWSAFMYPLREMATQCGLFIRTDAGHRPTR